MVYVYLTYTKPTQSILGTAPDIGKPIIRPVYIPLTYEYNPEEIS